MKEPILFPGLQVTMIDNYDSFTYNLVQYLQELEMNVTIYRNDEVTADQVIQRAPDVIFVSPGPSNPDNAGITLELIDQAAKATIPLMGICLGHQAIGQVFGGRVVEAEACMHGKVSEVQHKSTGVFDGLPCPLKATRYHSLIIEATSLPKNLQVTAWTEDGTIMGVQHTSLPIAGVQFHPESVLTEYGHAMLSNFVHQSLEKLSESKPSTK